MDEKDQLLVNLALRVVRERAKVKALSEILVEKGVISKQEYAEKVNDIFNANKKEYARELLGMTKEEVDRLFDQASE
jgi:polyhydroxyalkanoate synthesis regulator phasin